MRFWLIFLLQVLFISCNKEDKQAAAIVKQWIGKEIVYPKDMVFTIQGVDTLRGAHRDESFYTIISYVDSVGCTSCKLQLPRWLSFIEEMNSISREKVNVYFIFHSKNQQEIINMLKVNRYPYPVWIDSGDLFNRQNQISSNMAFQTFLLNKNDRVIAMGNPIYNLKVKELYLKIIQGGKIGREDENKMVRTKVCMEKTSASLGSFDWQKEQKATFTLKNIGDNPLVIEGISTSCGCTTVDYPKEPVRPGNSISLQVTYKADHPEHFNKTITVYCNAEASPVQLKISGDAE